MQEVEYRLGEENHIITTSAFTPIDDFLTRAYATITFRLRIPGWLVHPFFGPLAMKIFKQDARILKLQTETIQRFDGASFSSTEIDLLGAQIWRLMSRAQEGSSEGPPTDEWRREIRLRV